jgi:hypothetical protein
MNAYEFTFKCERCSKELTALVPSADVLEKQELNEMKFKLTCSNPDCEWSGTRTGAQAEKVKAILKPAPVCG